MTFLPGIREPYFPWKSIHMEFQFLGDGQHEFILVLNKLSMSYQFHHAIASPYEAQMEWERTLKDHEMNGIDALPPRSPSPLQLPSPIIPPANLAPQASRGINRKLTCEGDESSLGSSYNRSAKRRGVARRNKSKKGAKRMMTPDSDGNL
ncbi:hypothetical protein FLAG1_11568 [Fusarium langsethiae]|uniref:Uncharacterized protein n=1 Tax=Fusarium langsethiae TaxID=179993 RepID=A0A0N0DAR4_FUSLA|nr:hypothetical protein FLAG1_11568 [Fusarium langsethiae]GKU09929.1 unnamed protein product [Fusarium langsethiae]GKU16671.1 unnamed protein product [Fusarium langsethiae]